MAMKNNSRRWEVLGKSSKFPPNLKEIEKILLRNRGVKGDKAKKEFLSPTSPDKLSLKSLGISKSQVKKAAQRIKKAGRKGEMIIVYGDYDADGICATAILWERLYSLGLNVLPYIPERFSEGYGLNAKSIKKLKEENPNLGLIITVDHGIVASSKVDVAKKLGIDVIITDHHQPGKKKPKSYSLVHTTQVGGAAIAWILAREIKSSPGGLELVAIGTIADQLPLIGANRSFAKFGLEALNTTQRVGLNALYSEAAVVKGDIGPYEVGFIIAPRINAMGRLVHAIDSLRLLCTKKEGRARKLARLLNKTNLERQRIVEEVVLHARGSVVGTKGIIVLAHESYHEGVIGLAAAKLVEEFYRPAIVISKKGSVAKASARSISGFNIIEAIRKLEDDLLEGGGHPMAAGFSIETGKIDGFSKRINEVSASLLTEEVLTKKLKIDMEIGFAQLGEELLALVKSFEPTGLANPAPIFATRGVAIVEARVVGKEGTHLKLVLKKSGSTLEAIAFGLGGIYKSISPETKIDIAYILEENTWKERKSLQLKVKDLKVA
ncbi:single-stranded-DNA-specific exonuclease RecJ [Candidatus Woesebacteria bacterium]|nr:single-stranded-DNA-specific exonuclease RecJ [Candidatus Woesebacteria bacterium]